MSSRKILLPNNLLDKKNTISSETILKKYFKDNYTSKLVQNNLQLLNESKTLDKIKYINDNINILKNLKAKLIWFYKKIILPDILDDTPEIFNLNNEKFDERYDKFFILQTTNYSTKYVHINSLILYQYFYMKYINKYLFQISSINNYHYIHSEITSRTENPSLKLDKHILEYIKKYSNKYKVLYKPIHEKQPINMSEEDIKIFDFLQQIIKNIIKKTQKVMQNKNLGFKILTYGSYTSYNLNPNVIYNDIDIYHTDPLKFLLLIVMIFYFLFNINVDIFKIPYILGHLSLRYKNNHFMDCIYMDSYTMDNIPISLINNITFVDPLVQMLNNFRMMSELFRLNSIQKDKENMYLKYSSLLDYSNNILHIDYKNLTSINNIPVTIIENEFLIINLTEFLSSIKKFDEIKNLLNFDYLIISLCKPTYFLQLIDRDDIIISKQYFALFNEIAVEFYNKDKISPMIQKNYLVNDTAKKIHESQINIASEKTSVKFPEIIENIINNNNVLLMTSISTDIYIKNFVNNEKCIINTEISDISKETIFSSFILYQVLKHKPIKLIKFYMEILLSFLINNDKDQEFILLSNNNTCISEKYNNIYKQKKIKIQGNHLTFTLIDPTYLKNIFFYQIQNKEYYNYKNFLEITNYN